MKTLVLVISLLLLGLNGFTQFTVIPTGTSTHIRSITIEEDTLLILGENGYLAKSYDLGASIDVLPCPVPSYHYNYDMQEVNGMYYFMSLQSGPYIGHVMKSEDKGYSWDTVCTEPGFFTTLTMIDTTFGIMGHANQGKYAVTYGNDIWNIDTILGGASSPFASESFGDSTIIIMSASMYAAYRTDDRGATWNIGSCYNNEYEEIQFINSDTIYSIGHQGGDNSEFIYSFDGGQSFDLIPIGYNFTTSKREHFSLVHDLYFDSPSHGYLFGIMQKRIEGIQGIWMNEAVIYETHDYGQNWIPYLSGISGDFYSHVAVNDSISFISGSNGLLVKWNRNMPLSNPMFIGTEKHEQQINLFPNPFNESTTLNLEGIELPLTLTIYDQTGRLVRTEIIESSKHILKQNSLSIGIYYYTVGNIQGKFVISN